MRHVWLAYNDSLDNDIFDPLHYQVWITTCLHQEPHDSVKRPLVPALLFGLVLLSVTVERATPLVLHEGRVVLVDCVVGEMHVEIVDIGWSRCHVGLSSKPGDSLLVNVDSQGVQAIDEDVNSEIVLQIVDQVRLVEVLLDHVATIIRALLYYSFAVS